MDMSLVSLYVERGEVDMTVKEEPSARMTV